MAVQYSTFDAVQVAGNWKANPMAVRFYTGTPILGSDAGKLSAFHAYRSFAWFDAAAIEAALRNQRVLSLSFTAKSAGDDRETIGLVPVRLYRTDLKYVPGNIGWTSANTLRPDEGMTYAEPYNEHFLEYVETTPFERGAWLENDTVFSGEAAQEMARSLAEGNALGTWNLRPGETVPDKAPAYMQRHLVSISITIAHEPQSMDVTPPTDAIVSDNFVNAGDTVDISFSGATQPSVGNDITGYSVQYSTSVDGGESWSAWADEGTYPLPATSGSVTVSTGAPNEVRRYRIRTNGTISNSAWASVYGTVATATDPVIDDAYYDLNGLQARVYVDVSASPYGSNLYIYCNDQPVVMLPAQGGLYSFFRQLDEGLNELAITVQNEFGGQSAEKIITILASRNDYGENWISFKGKRSEDFGCIVQHFMNRSIPAERAKTEKVIGRAGNIYETEGENVYEAYDETLTLITNDSADIGTITAWLNGEGELILGDDPTAVYDVRILKAVTFERVSRRHKNRLINVTLNVQPFHRRTDEQDILITRNNTRIFNAGDVQSYPILSVSPAVSGVASITIDGKTLSVSCDGPFTVDCKEKAVINESGEIMSTVDGVFPVFPKGMSSITFTNINSIRMSPRTLWR